ncbi:hypothetical protein [Castellaniella sp.]|uniref:hypothetical protein n=1 Tax=Castellaniella sp. TaxID=1955812 RepID=UPI00356A4129
MPLDSQLIRRLDPDGQVLDIRLEGHVFRVYVAQRPADVEQVAQLVPAEQFQGDGDVHVAALHTDDDMATQIGDVLFNLNPGDAIVLLCTSQSAYQAALAELGQDAPAPSRQQ